MHFPPRYIGSPERKLTPRRLFEEALGAQADPEGEGSFDDHLAIARQALATGSVVGGDGRLYHLQGGRRLEARP